MKASSGLWRDVAALTILGASSAAWVFVSTQRLPAMAALVLLALPALLLRAGRIVTGSLQLPTFFALDFVVGATTFAMLLILWKLVAPHAWSIGLAFVISMIVILPRLVDHTTSTPATTFDLFAILIAEAATLGWLQELLHPVIAGEAELVFELWPDFFSHASHVAHIMQDKSLLQLGHPEWHGLPATPYNYASYVFPALLAKLGGLSAYEAAVAFWAPFGSVLMCLAAYAVGCSLWSPRAGVVSLAFTVLLPDASMLNVGHPLYSYFWLQQVAPAGMYGVAVAATALVFVMLGTRHRRSSWIWTGLAGGSIVVAFKAHVFVAAFPLLTATALIGAPMPTRRRLAVCVASLILSVVFAVIARRYHMGPDIRVDGSGAASYWRFLAKTTGAVEPVHSWFAVFATASPLSRHFGRAVCLLLTSSLGFATFLFPVGLLVAVRRNVTELADWIPLGAIVVLLVMTFGLSPNSYFGTSSEFMHRPFIWAFFVTSALAGGRFYTLMKATFPLLTRRAVAPMATMLLLIPAFLGSGMQLGKNSWAKGEMPVRLSRGLVDCANFIRTAKPADALIQDSRLDGFNVPILGALSERPSFAARPKLWLWASRSFRESRYRENLDLLAQLQAAPTIPELRDKVRKTQIHWYVLHPGDSVSWPDEIRNHPVFESRGYRLYDLHGVAQGDFKFTTTGRLPPST